MSQGYTPDLNKKTPGKSIASTPFFPSGKKAALFGLLTFIILAALIGMLVYQRVLITKDTIRKQTYDVAIATKEKLQESLAQGIAAIKTLSFFIQPDGAVKNFEQVASEILSANKGVDVLQLVPNGVISYVYPLKGNEPVIGYNILTDPLRNKEAFKAIQKKEVFYAGPLVLKQGGVGVVGRLPVFRNNKFWGFSAVIIKMPTLFKAAGIDSAGTNGYFFQLTKINPDSQKEEHFIVHPRGFAARDFVTVNMLNQEWKLSAEPVNANKPYRDIFWLSLLGFMFAILGGIFVFILIKRPEKLDELVKIRTAELQESEEQYRSLIEQASDGVIVYSFDGTMHHFNKAAHTAAGYTRQEFALLNLRDLLQDKTLQSDNPAPDDLHSGKTVSFERKMYCKDGTMLDVEINASLLPEGNLLAFVRDISQRKKAELLLRNSEIKYRSLIEQASDGIIITDLVGVILEVNRSICELGGYCMEEMIGHKVETFLPKQDVTDQPLRFEALLKGETLLYERRMLRKDGTVIDVEVNSKMAIGDTLIGFVRDITERKKGEEALRKSNERFELIAKATNDAIWDHDFITDETTGNDKLYALYDFDKQKDKIHFDTFIHQLHPDDKDRMLSNLDEAVSRKNAFITEEFRFMLPDGMYVNMYDRAYIRYDQSGKPTRMMGVMQDITGRVRSAEAIIKEKALSDSIINSLQAVFYLYNKEGKFLRWNKSFELVTGYSSEEVKHLHPLHLFDSDEQLLLEEKIKNVFLVGHDTVEAHFLTKGRQKIPYYFSGMRIEYEGEDCLMGFGLDFSDKVKAEKAIKESEQKFRSLVEQAADGVAILQPSGALLYISPAGQRITGYDEADIAGLNVFNLTYNEDRSEVNERMKEAIEKPGSPVKSIPYRMLHKDGSWRWIENTITSMLDIPSINGIVANFRDVTEKILIEKKIIAEKELSDTIINSLPGIFYLYDHTGKFLRWNKNFEIVTGYSAEEIKNMHPLDFYDEDQKQLVAERLNSIFRKKVPGMESMLLTKDRKKIPFYYNSLAIEFEGVPSVLGMGFDATERRKIEQELLVSNENLERKAAELIASYTELERFAYIVSHDLQEPLRMVSSFLKLLEKKYKDQLDETGEKYIHFAVDGADRMKQLIMDLLEYSRTGTNKDISADIDMNEITADVLKVLKGSIDEEQATITSGVLPVLHKVNKLQMFQLVQNLVANAVKYHTENKPVIHIEATEKEDHWLFSVRDNGIGIDARFYEKIFIIFQRLHNKNEFSGTGVGLSICKKIIEKHGGKIWVESVVGEGSVFYFTISKKL